MPDDSELAKLLSIVQASHGWLPGFDLPEFRRSFWAQGKCFRTAAPDKSRYYQAWVDDANALLERFDKRPIEGASFLAACIGAGDVVWQRADPRVGALPELGLNKYVGARCSNAWKRILTGEAQLLEPITPGIVRAPSDALPRPKFYEADAQGRMVEYDPAPLWRR